MLEDFSNHKRAEFSVMDFTELEIFKYSNFRKFQ